MEEKLTVKQKKFCEYYIQTGNATDSARKAGYSQRSAQAIGKENLMKPLIAEYTKLDDSKVFYSMWRGYLDCNKTAFNESLYNFLKPYEFEYMHTSGHADIETLKIVFEAVSA